MRKRIINRNDLHLLKLLSAYPRLRRKLSAAIVVPAQSVPADVATMNSKVEFRDQTQDMPRFVKLVYPWQADGVGCISVLSPLGTALLGASVGEDVEAEIPGAGRRRIRVQDVISQPEREARKRSLGEKSDDATKRTFSTSDTFSFSLGF